MVLVQLLARRLQGRWRSIDPPMRSSRDITRVLVSFPTVDPKSSKS